MPRVVVSVHLAPAPSLHDAVAPQLRNLLLAHPDPGEQRIRVGLRVRPHAVDGLFALAAREHRTDLTELLRAPDDGPP